MVSTTPELRPGAAVPPAVRRLAEVWHRVERRIALVAFGAIALLLIADVVGRELLGPVLRGLKLTESDFGVPGAQQMAVFALVIGAFCGIGIVTATNSALVPRVAFGLIPASWAPAMNRIADFVTGSVMLAVAWYAFQFVLASKATQMRAPVLTWEVWPFQLAIPAGFISAALRCWLFAIWPGLKPPPPEHQE
jgi:TRAP-type C4-dicarboxylate transport system permease small subunit